MAETRVYVVGGSHVTAIANALKRGAVGGAVRVNVDRFAPKGRDAREGEITLDDALQRVAALEASDIVALSVIGTAHNIFGLLQHPEAFDIVADEADAAALKAGAAVVPTNALLDMFDAYVDDNRTIRRLRDATAARIVHIATPPPKFGIEALSQSDQVYNGTLIAEAGFSPAPLRAKLWRLEMQSMARAAKRAGMGFVEAPAAAVDAGGYLKPEYQANDLTHANHAYGALILKQFERLAALD
jgi:hypothetical protein